MSKKTTRWYNPKIGGAYGGYVNHEVREHRSQKQRRKTSYQEKVAKELLEQMIFHMNRENRWVARNLANEAKNNPVLRKNVKFMRRLRSGLSFDDMGYLKSLVKSF